MIADRVRGDFYVLAAGRVSEVTTDGTVVGGPWPLPDGWGLPNDGAGVPAVDGQIVLETVGGNTSDQEIALWRPAGGELRSVGTARWVYDTTVTAAGQKLLAWVDTSTCGADGAGCGLVLTDLDTGDSSINALPQVVDGSQSVSVVCATAPSEPGTESTPCKFPNGFIGGGSFSPDGSQLAVSLALYDGNVDPATAIAILSTPVLQSGEATRVGTILEAPRTAEFPVGEPFTASAWSLDGRTLVYLGLSEPGILDVATGQSQSFTGVDWSYSIATLQ